MGAGKKVLNDVKPYMMMVLLQVGYAGMYIVSVASLKRGMSHFVLVAYRNLVATVLMTPFALIFERGVRPKMTVTIFIKICGLAFLEPVLDQNLYYLGNKLTSASFSSALVNILPAVTFLMAVILRMEKLRLRSLHSQAKIFGTVSTVAGAVLMIKYHGPVVRFPWSVGHHPGAAAAAAATQSTAAWFNGTIMIITSCVAWAGFFVLQSNTLRSYPAQLSLTSLICIVGTAMSGSVALVAERRDMGAWVIGFDTRLFTAVYSGVVCSGVVYYVCVVWRRRERRERREVAMGAGKKVLNDVKPYMMMVLLQVGYAGMYIVSVASLKRGMSHFVLVAYRNLVATVLMTPFALIFERGVRPKMTVTIFIKICGLAFLEPVLDQNLYYLGNKLTSASFSSALVNILPAVTFLMAVILRMEKLRLRSLHSQAKIFGTVSTVAGAVLMIKYHGPVVRFPWSVGHHPGAAAAAAATQSTAAWFNGTIMIITSCVAWAGFFVLQSNTLRSYPAQLSLTSLICIVGTAMSGSVALVAERRDMGAWVIGFDTRLFTAVYSGVVCSGVAYYVQGLVTRTRGPVFVTAFQPLCMIITAVMGSTILKEETTLGSVIGAAIIVVGLYSLIWGKSSDQMDKPVAAVSEKLALPLTSVANGNCKHATGGGGGQVADVETAAVKGTAVCC